MNYIAIYRLKNAARVLYELLLENTTQFITIMRLIPQSLSLLCDPGLVRFFPINIIDNVLYSLKKKKIVFSFWHILSKSVHYFFFFSYHFGIFYLNRFTCLRMWLILDVKGNLGTSKPQYFSSLEANPLDWNLEDSILKIPIDEWWQNQFFYLSIAIMPKISEHGHILILTDEYTCKKRNNEGMHWWESLWCLSQMIVI